MLTPRARTWALAVAALGLVLVAVLIALPFVIRHFAIRRAEAMTGRTVTIADVDLNPFTGRLVLSEVRVGSPGDAPPLATVGRIEVSYRLVPFLRGRTEVDRLVVDAPVVHVVRRDGGALSVEDVVEHWSARPAGEPLRTTIGDLRVRDGRVIFVDHAVAPAREWVLGDVSVAAHAISTDADGGRLSATFRLAGGTGEMHLQNVQVRPFAAPGRVQLASVDVAPFSAYLPGESPIRLTGGRFATNVSLEYDAGGVLRASGQGTLQDLVVARVAQEPAFVTVPHATLRLDDLAWTGDALAVADVVLAAERATVFDATAARPRALEVRDLQAAFHDPDGTAGPGRITVSVGLPGDGTLNADGPGEIFPPTAQLSVEVRGLDAALAQVWIPADAPVTPTDGEVGATLQLRYAAEERMRASGRAWVTGLALTRHGQPAPVVRDDRVEATVGSFTLDEQGAAFERLRIVASPTLRLGARPSPLHVPQLTVTASGARFPGQDPTDIDARITLPHGGTLTATGQVQLAAATATMTVVAKDVDAMLASPYLPPQAPVSLASGRLDARLAVRWREALHLGGDVTLRTLTVGRRDQDAPLVEHAQVHARLSDLVVRDGALAVARVTVTGAPTIVDATASPPQRFELSHLRLTATDLTWPSRAPMQLEGRAETADGARAALTGSLDAATLAADVRLAFEGVDVTRVRGYIPPGVPVAVDEGRARTTMHVRHARGTVEIDADGALEDVGVTLTTGPVVPITDDRVTFRVEDLVLKDGRIAVGAVTVDGSPQLERGEPPPPPFALHAVLRDLVWPGGPPADFSITAQPDPGRIAIEGTFAPATRTVDVTIRAEDAALAAFAPLIPIEAPLDGQLDGQLAATVRPDAAAPFAVRGDLTVRAFRIGPADTAPVRAAALRVQDLALEGRTLHAARIVLEDPSVRIERSEDGSFPLRAMLTPDGAGAAAPRETAPETRERPEVRPAGGKPDEALRWALDIDEIRVTGGAVRFVDRTSRPFYSEELTQLDVTVRDLSTIDQGTTGLAVQGIVGANAALDLRGEMAPFAQPFFLEVSGTLRDFSVPRTNPLLRRFLEWIARRGELTTQVHYRIVGDELTATNELTVRRLDVERTRDGDRADRLVGLPLGLVVALLKDASGDIHFTLPVSGELGSPKFSFADAIKSALSNVLGRLVTSPFRAIGSVFKRGDSVDEVRITPVTFDAGSAALTPAAAERLQRVADFLRERPYVRLGLEATVSERDLEALRAAEVTARIQRVQREERIADFADAARRVWRHTVPDGLAPPDDANAIVRALAERAPAPSDAARQLAERRVSVARTHLREVAGIATDRLAPAPGPPSIGVEGEGRVEFSLEPAS